MTQSVDIHALSGAYALDALDDIERAAFRRHLAGCETCTLEVAELRETTARLTDATATTPPPQLRANVLAEARRTRQVGPAKADRESHTGAAALARWRRWTAGAVAAGILAVGAATATFVIQEQRVRDAQRIEAVVSAPDAVVRRVPVTGGGEVTMVISPSRDAGVVMLNGLSTPDSAHAYQLWFIAGGRATSAGVLAAGKGSGAHLVDGVSRARDLGVTLEPAGGSRQPSMEPLVTVPLS